MRLNSTDRTSAKTFAIAAELHLVIGALARRLREEAGADSLTGAQKSVLLRLERDGPATGTVLARAEGMRPQSMGAIITALQGAGYVSGTADPADGRQTIVSLTDHFREWVSAARTARQDWLLRALEMRLTAQDQQKLADSVDLLKRLLET